MEKQDNIKEGFFRNFSNDVLLFYVEKVKRESGISGRLRRIIESHLSHALNRTGNSYQMQRLKVLQLSARLRRARAASEKMERFLHSMKKSHERHSRQSRRYHEELSAAIERYDSSDARRASEIEAEHAKRVEDFRAEIQHADEELATLKAETKTAEDECAAAESDLLLLKAEFLRRRKARPRKRITASTALFFAAVIFLVLALAVHVLFPSAAYGIFRSIGEMHASRQNHRATLLDTGEVLITGGEDYAGRALQSAELFDPEDESFQLIEDMAEPRIGHSATLLKDRRVLVTGGRKKAGPVVKVFSSAEIYDPPERQFLPVGQSMGAARWRHEAILLESGWVLIAGGLSRNGPLDSMEFFIPGKMTFQDAGRMERARTDFALSLLEDGHVFIAGGSDGKGRPVGGFEVYRLVKGKLELTDSGELKKPRYDLTATRLSDGRVLVAGGTADGKSGQSLAEIYDPRGKSMSVCPRAMITARHRHSATPLPGGRVLIAGGYLWDNPKSAELFDPAREEFKLTDHLVRNRRNHRATLLNDGAVLITGGFTFKEGKEWILREGERYHKSRAR
jgi:hypothetical protein